MKIFDWLAGSLSAAFADPAPRKPLPERTIEQAQNHFFDAIVRERLDDIDRIVERYPNDFLKWRDHNDQTPLQAAQKSDSLPSFVQLVSHGADRSESYGEGWNPLMVAFRTNNPEFIDYLLGPQTKNLNTVAKSGDYSYTMMHMAVMNRDIERVLLLIEFGADEKIKASPDKKNRDVTAEELAIKLKLPKIAEALHNAEGIREVKRKEWAEVEEYAKTNVYVPRGDDPPATPYRAQGESKETAVHREIAKGSSGRGAGYRASRETDETAITAIKL